MPPSSDVPIPQRLRSPRAAHPRHPKEAAGEVSHDGLQDAVTAARDAAIIAFKDAFPAGPDLPPEVRMMVCATVGNPSTEESHSEVRFAAPGGVAISHHDKVAMALASMKAISPPLYATMMTGIERGRRMTLRGLRACFRAATR